MNDQALAGGTVRVHAQDNTLPRVILAYPLRNTHTLAQTAGTQAAVTHSFNGLSGRSVWTQSYSLESTWGGNILKSTD